MLPTDSSFYGKVLVIAILFQTAPPPKKVLPSGFYKQKTPTERREFFILSHFFPSSQILPVTKS
jgi:hypothetical protein